MSEELTSRDTWWTGKDIPAPLLSDPEQDFELTLVVKVRGHGRMKDQHNVAFTVARALHYRIGERCIVLADDAVVNYRDQYRSGQTEVHDSHS